MSRLSPLSEEPINEGNTHTRNNTNFSKKSGQSWRVWLKNHLPLIFHKKSELKILLSVMGCPLSPISFDHPKHSLTNNTNVATSAQYIIQHYVAATGCKKIKGSVKTMYATGSVKMMMSEETTASSGSTGGGGDGATTKMSSGLSSPGVAQYGCFVVWQMIPDKWLIELVVSGQKIIAGSDGKLAWRHTPWLGAHVAKGGVRPLRRGLQGLDPVAVAAIFSEAQFMGEKKIEDEDCFALKLSVDQTILADRSDSTAEIIKHVMIGYFSQRSGLLVYLEDSNLTRIQSLGSNPTYWETSIMSSMKDYRTVDNGVMISHSGSSIVNLTRFSNNMKANPLVKRMEEIWTIDDISYNVPGLSIDCFIPPEEVQSDPIARS